MSMLEMNHQEQPIQDEFALLQKVTEVFGRLRNVAEKLPKQKRQLLSMYISALESGFAAVWNGESDPEEQKEVNAVIFQGIEELFTDIDVTLVDHILDPESDAVKKARQWYAKVGETVRRLRRAKGLHQVDLAAKTGLSQSAISLLERGKLTPTHLTVEKIAKALRVSPEEIDPGWADAARD